jgi:hypothetical protein
MGCEAGTPKGDRLDILATLIEAYEAKHYPMDPPDPIGAIKFRIEQQGLTTPDSPGDVTHWKILRVDRAVNVSAPLVRERPFEPDLPRGAQIHLELAATGSIPVPPTSVRA